MDSGLNAKNKNGLKLKWSREIDTKKALKIFRAFFCDPVWIRTKGLLLRRQLLYPTELRDPIISAIEPQIKIKLRSLLYFNASNIFNTSHYQ